MFSRLTKNDEYYTKKESWADIAQYLPRDKVIWECFYSHNSKSAIYLRELGFEVIFEPVDFVWLVVCAWGGARGDVRILRDFRDFLDFGGE